MRVVMISIVSVIVSGALLGCSNASNLEPFTSSRQDSLGDSIDEGQNLAGPDYTDIVSATVSSDGNELAAEVELNGSIPKAVSFSEDWGCFVVLDTDEDLNDDYMLSVSVLDDGRHVGFDDWDTGHAYDDERFPGDYSVNGSFVKITIPLAQLGNPKSIRWNVSSEWGRYPESGQTILTTDYLPNGGPQEWIKVAD